MKRPRLKWGFCALLLATMAAAPAFADDAPPKLDSGDTAWMLASTALVLLMTIPGLALFYAGMVRKKNILATMMQSFTICCIVTIVWMVAAYSIAFTTGNAFMGDFSRILLHGIADHIVKGNDTQAFVLASGVKDVRDMATTILESVYMMFQMTFAIITPALIAGAFADRMKFSAMCLFMALWSLFVYSPIAHMEWSPSGYWSMAGVLDFAGGTVVHINAGVAGPGCALVLGKRAGYPTTNKAPSHLANAVTRVAPAAAALGWMLAEWIAKGKPSVLGAASGAVAGLVAITPASGFVLPGGSIVIGVAAGVGCFWAATSLKHMLGYDDSLDCFGVHGIGGIIGAILTGVFSYGPLTATDATPDGSPGGMSQFILQLEGVVSTIVISGVGTLIFFFNDTATT